MARVTLYRDEIIDGDLPPVCVRCGARAVERVPKKFSCQQTFTPWLLLGAIRVWRRTVPIPVCRDHTGWIWSGLGGLRAIGMTEDSITLTGVSDEFADALENHREGREVKERMAAVARRRRQPSGELQAVLVSPPPERPTPVWPWFLVGGLVLTVVAVVVVLAATGALTPPPRPIPQPPPGFNPPWPPAAANKQRPPVKLPPQHATALAVAPAAPFPVNLPWLPLHLACGKDRWRLLTAAELDRALAEVRSGNPFHAADAANRLAQALPVDGRRREAAAALEGLLTVRHPPAQQAAAHALSVWGTADSVPALIRLLEDPFPLVRGAALEALPVFKDERAAGPVARRLTSFPDRERARKALEAMGPIAEKAVLPLLDATDREARIAACQVLGAIGGPASVPDLLRITVDPDPRVAAAAAVAHQAICKRL